MPRPSPSTRADIEARSRLTGLPVDAEANELPEGGITPIMRRFAACWDFSAAMDTLGVRYIEDRRRCEDWLILICVTYDLIRRAEEQETPGRKARALQLAPRWQKKRMQEQKLFWRKARNADKQLAEQALRLWKQTPWPPQSLEQEAVRALEAREREEGRELDHIPQSRDDFAPLRGQMKQMARRGRYKSWALRNTIHALQACATTFNKKLIWEEGCHAPPGLIKFLVEALGAANIQHPNPEEHYSTFVDLMLRPRKLTERQIERMEPPPKPSKAERRLAKVFL
jgi:hypothetical protein